jgi:hypothetical protein
MKFSSLSIHFSGEALVKHFIHDDEYLNCNEEDYITANNQPACLIITPKQSLELKFQILLPESSLANPSVSFDSHICIERVKFVMTFIDDKPAINAVTDRRTVIFDSQVLSTRFQSERNKAKNLTLKELVQFISPEKTPPILQIVKPIALIDLVYPTDVITLIQGPVQRLNIGIYLSIYLSLYLSIYLSI